MKSSHPNQPLFAKNSLLRTLGILAVVILILRSSVASPYWVPTSSMEPTIKVGDRLMGFKLAYGFRFPFIDWQVLRWGSPARGDIIIFSDPRSPDVDIVKRVVGIAGDEIIISGDVLHVNGKPQPAEVVNDATGILDDIDDNRQKVLLRETLDGRPHWIMQNTPAARLFGQRDWPPGGFPFKVPESSVFVVGDNRDNSADSRVWGEIPLVQVRGRAVFVLWSMFTPRDGRWPSLRWGRFFQRL